MPIGGTGWDGTWLRSAVDDGSRVMGVVPPSDHVDPTRRTPHRHLPAPDLDEAKRWWTDLLGIAPSVDQPFYVGFGVGDYELALMPDADPAGLADLDVPAGAAHPAAEAAPTGGTVVPSRLALTEPRMR